ncbi:MAG: hypothetical protein GX284_15565 [Clostridiales bacterium]|nr:hypothetical protein [Clostridiales bacterium]
MKRIKGIVCGLLLVLMLHVNTMPLFAASEVTTTIADIFTTNITTSGSQVTLAVGVKKDAGVTSGKIVVSYDESMMTVFSVKGNNIWEMEDINTIAAKDNKKAVSYAWVDSDLKNAEGTMLTITFQSTAAGAGKEVAVQTDVVELYQGDNVVSVPTKTVTDTVKLPADTTTTVPEKTIIDQIKNAQPGETITIPVHDGNTVISKAIMEAAQGRDVYLRFQMDNGVVWLVHGTDIKTPKDIDLGIKLNTNNIPQKAINAIGDDKAKYQMQFTLSYEREFGTTITVIIPLGDAAVGYFANLYYYNPTTGELEFVESCKVGADGNAIFHLTHASDYVVVVSENDGAKLAAKTQAKKTGDETNVAGYVLLLGAAAVVLAEAARKKVKHA